MPLCNIVLCTVSLCHLGTSIEFLDAAFSLLFCLGNIELFFQALNEQLKSLPLLLWLASYLSTPVILEIVASQEKVETSNCQKH